jgi:DNA-binding CsgD family transcriptional regulator
MEPAVALLERETPRSRLEAALACARRGRGGVVSIEGEAGIGKTALALSFADAHRADARVHIGGCENLATPEPLGPLRDVARESQGRFSLSGGGQLGTFEALLRLLTGGRGPGLLLIEDLHWADDASLDLVRYLARRIRNAPVLVVVTLRDDEVGSQVRLASLWADMPRDGHTRIELGPLSLNAVSTLAHPSGRAGREVLEITGGNPFHVTEYLATAGDGVPRSVQAATLSRASALSRAGRRVLDWAAIFPRQIDEASLRLLARDADSEGVEECLRSGMLNAHGNDLAFRHELARRAIQDAMSPLRRRELHAAALDLLKDRDGVRAAEAAHHAERAGDLQALIDFSVHAADEATTMGAHREAFAHLTKALAHSDGLCATGRARLLERQAEAGERCGAFDAAMLAIDEAIALHQRAGDRLALGNALRIAARLYWLNRRVEEADRRSQAALEALADQGETWQYAMALAGQAQLDLNADRNALAIQRGTEAMSRAEALGRSDIYLHAMASVAIAHAGLNAAEGLDRIATAISEAHRRGALDSLPRLHAGEANIRARERDYVGLFEAVANGIDASVARENAPHEAYARGARAAALLDLGRTREAMVEGEHVVFGPFPRGIPSVPAVVALSRARVRLGAPEGGVIDQVRALPTEQGELVWLVPIAIADAEAHWLGRPRPDAVRNLRAVVELILQAGTQPWALRETALWLAILGEPVDLSAEAQGHLSEAHRLHIAGRWREAGDAWRLLGCPYEQAIALSGGDEASQREALRLFDRLGAAPAAARLRREMRAAGVRGVPSGPRSARRNNPAGLTPRQNEVLGLLAEGLSNDDIAGRLGASPKTVEHHVGAILVALEASSRLSAVQIARARGLLAGVEI